MGCWVVVVSVVVVCVFRPDSITFARLGVTARNELLGTENKLSTTGESMHCTCPQSSSSSLRSPLNRFLLGTMKSASVIVLGVGLELPDETTFHAFGDGGFVFGDSSVPGRNPCADLRTPL